MSNVIASIDRPYQDGTIEVFTKEAGAASYEWRIVTRGRVHTDSGDAGYTSPALAMSDAIAWDMGESMAMELTESETEAMSQMIEEVADGMQEEGDMPADPDPLLVRIQWLANGQDSTTDNIQQAHRVADRLRAMATQLVDEAADARTQRRHLNPDHVNGRRGMLYLDDRIRATEHLASLINRLADEAIDYAAEQLER